MGWGVLTDKKTRQPPGTILLEELLQNVSHDANAKEKPLLKKDGNTILQPQPSDSPNDPLNWSTKIKLSIFLTLIVAMTAVGGVQAMLATAGRILAEQYDVDYPTVVRTLQSPSIAAGAVALFFASAFAAVWGKRLPIIVGVAVIWINMLIGYFANSLEYYRALSIVSNVFGAAPELLIAPIVTDLVFVHQRGRFMALSTVVAIIGIDARYADHVPSVESDR
jgi:hypothetical protein